MRTSKPFATISYNTDEFLKIKLDELVQTGVLDFWCYVNHLPEIDETKAHKHLYCVPSRLYDTASFCDYMKEIDLKSPTSKPLGCIACRPSKFDDWYLYSSHHKQYLATKGQARKYNYPLDDFKMSDEDYFTELRHQIDMSKLNRMQVLTEAVVSGETYESLVSSGQIPVQLINQYEKAFYMMRDTIIPQRNGRTTHTPKEEE